MKWLSGFVKDHIVGMFLFTLLSGVLINIVSEKLKSSTTKMAGKDDAADDSPPKTTVTTATVTTAPYPPRCPGGYWIQTASKYQPGWDFPATRAAMKGKRQFAGTCFVEAEGLNGPVFGAIVPDRAPKEELERILLEGKATSSGLAPPLCRDPKILRTLFCVGEAGAIQ